MQYLHSLFLRLLHVWEHYWPYRPIHHPQTEQFLHNFYSVHSINSSSAAGQFWNIPITIAPVSDMPPDASADDTYYYVTVSHPDSTPRTFLASYYPRTWEVSLMIPLHEPRDNLIIIKLYNDLYKLILQATNDAFRHLPCYWELNCCISSIQVARDQNDPCLYAGSAQGGKADFGDSVIQGLYTDYTLDGPFDTNYQYSKFDSNLCQ